MKALLSTLCLTAGLLTIAAPASAAIVLRFTPTDSHINVGESVRIDLSVSGLDSEVLSAYDLNLRWNAAVVNYEDADFTSLTAQLGGSFFHLSDSLLQGDVGILGSSNLLDDDLANVQSNSFLIGSLLLRGVADGATNVTLGADLDLERNLVGRGSQTLSVTVEAACVAVGGGTCQAPEPASWALAAMALTGLVGIRRVRSRAFGA